MLLTAGRAVGCFLRGARTADGVLLISRDEPGLDASLGDETEAAGSCVGLQCCQFLEHGCSIARVRVRSLPRPVNIGQ